MRFIAKQNGQNNKIIYDKSLWVAVAMVDVPECMMSCYRERWIGCIKIGGRSVGHPREYR